MTKEFNMDIVCISEIICDTVSVISSYIIFDKILLKKKRHDDVFTKSLRILIKGNIS